MSLESSRQIDSNPFSLIEVPDITDKIQFPKQMKEKQGTVMIENDEEDEVQTNREIYPLEMGYLPEFFRKKAERELNEGPENREKCMKQLRDVLNKDKQFSGLKFDDDFLLQYLRCRKYNVGKAFAQLKTLVILMKKNPEIFTGIRFETLSLSTRNKILTILPKRCQDGCTILMVQLGNWFPERFPVEEIKRTLVVLLLQSLRDPMTQVNGFKVIFDVKSNPIRHLRHCTPSNLYLMYHITQECVAGRFKAIHVVNNSLTFKTAWIIIKHFFSDKLKQRFFFHSACDTLLNYFPSSILPSKYGGDLEDYDMTDWLRKVTQPESLATLGGRVVNN